MNGDRDDQQREWPARRRRLQRLGFGRHRQQAAGQARPRLPAARPLAKTPEGASGQPWSNAPIDLSGLNYVDAQVRISANEAVIGDARIAPLALDAKLAGGVLKAGTANLGAYGGQVSGEVILDATTGAPSFAMHSDLVGVRALPLLQGLADSTASTASCRPSSLCARRHQPARADGEHAGHGVRDFQDGAIRGINVAQMIRSLTSGTLSGWQEEARSRARSCRSSRPPSASTRARR